MEALQSYSVKQLKNIIVAHNASEKVNIIKKYGLMKKPELIKAIQETIKQEHLSMILDALLLKSGKKTPRVSLSEAMMPEEGETMKIKVKKQGTLDTNLVKEMLMIMEDNGSKAAEKIRKSAMIDELSAKQENAIVEDFIKMMEMGGEKVTERVKKTSEVMKPQNKEETFWGTEFMDKYYNDVVALNKKNKKYLELLKKPVFGEKRNGWSMIDLLKTKLDSLGYVDDKDSWNKSSKYKKGVYLIQEFTQTTERFVRRLLEIYYDEERKSLTGSARTKELNKQLKSIMSYGVSKADIRDVFSRISVEGQQKIYKEFSDYMLKVPNEYTDEEKVDMLDFYMKEIVRPQSD